MNLPVSDIALHQSVEERNQKTLSAWSHLSTDIISTSQVQIVYVSEIIQALFLKLYHRVILVYLKTPIENITRSKVFSFVLIYLFPSHLYYYCFL